jgi:hypothetical protein
VPVRHASSRHYSSQERLYQRRSPSPDYDQIRRRQPSPPIATLDPLRGRNVARAPGVRIIQTQEQHRIVQDTDTGISALVPILQVSSSQMGLDLSALMRPSVPDSQPGRIGPSSRAPRPIQSSRGFGESRYHSRSRSPRRDYQSRRRSPPRHPSPPRRRASPSPRRTFPPPNQHLRGSRREQPRRVSPAPVVDPVQWGGIVTPEPLAGWGETIMDPVPSNSTIWNPTLPTSSRPPPGVDSSTDLYHSMTVGMFHVGVPIDYSSDSPYIRLIFHGKFVVGRL